MAALVLGGLLAVVDVAASGNDRSGFAGLGVTGGGVSLLFPLGLAAFRRRLGSWIWPAGSAWLLLFIVLLAATRIPTQGLAGFLSWSGVIAGVGSIGLVLALALPEPRGETAIPEPTLRFAHGQIPTTNASLEPAVPWRASGEPPEDHVDQEPVVETWTRLLTDGGERLEGTFRVDFLPGERIVRRHVPIVPPFQSSPHGWCECDDAAYGVEIDVSQSYGVRLTIRRRGDHSLPDGTNVALMLQATRPLRRVA